MPRKAFPEKIGVSQAAEQCCVGYLLNRGQITMIIGAMQFLWYSAPHSSELVRRRTQAFNVINSCTFRRGVNGPGG